MKSLITFVALLATVGCTNDPSLDTTQGALGAPRGNATIALCHVAGPDRIVSIAVAERAVDAHLDHGDFLAIDGRCDACAGLPDGAMFCGGEGFWTCTDAGPVWRACAPGTACRDVDDGILCDWPSPE